MNQTVRQTVLPLIAAMIWGTAFAAQSMCTPYLGPFTLNAIRSGIAFVLLLLICLFRRGRMIGSLRDIVVGGLCCGIPLFLAVNAQQLGLGTTSSGKAGFITALYIVIVPVTGIFFHQKVRGQTWAAVAIAVVGMYFLCVSEAFSISTGDLMILLCAFLFSAQILFVDHFAQLVDGIALSCAQFLVVSVLSAAVMCVRETPTAQAVAACIWPILYIAVFSSCLAYTLQILAQKGGNPTVVSLLLSLEAVFAVLGGAVLLGERLTGRELFGCAVMTVAILLAVLPPRKKPVRGGGVSHG